MASELLAEWEWAIGQHAIMKIQERDARSQSGDLELAIPVEIVGSKVSFGQVRLQIAPIGKTRGGQPAGGKQWVTPGRLSFDEKRRK